MPQQVGNIIDSIFGADPSSGLDKTAESILAQRLSQPGSPADPYAQFSIDELAEMAKVAESGAARASAGPDSGVCGLSVNELEQLEGQTAAHATVHELGQIKVAVANGYCRVCKEAPFDARIGSVCASCASA